MPLLSGKILIKDMWAIIVTSEQIQLSYMTNIDRIEISLSALVSMRMMLYIRSRFHNTSTLQSCMLLHELLRIHCVD